MNWKIYEEKMNEHAKGIYKQLHAEYSRLRTGKPNPKMFDDIHLDYYGTATAIAHVANISSPDPRTIVIKPYERSILKDIASTINNSGLNLNPQVDADLIRITFPQMTEETRKQTVKEAKAITEEAKVRVRKARQHVQDDFKKETETQEDDKKYFQTELDRVTKDINAKIDNMFKEKEAEILKI